MKRLKITGPDQFTIGGSQATYVLIICALLWMVNFMDRQVMAVVLEPMKHDLGFSDAQVGWITSALFISMALFAMPVAHWADRWSRRKVIGIFAIVWSVAMLLTSLGTSFYGIFIPRLLTGAGQAGFSAAAIALISAGYPEEVRAGKLGIFNFFQMIGIMTGLAVGGYLSVHYGGWQTPFLVFAIPGIVLGVFAFGMQDYDSIPTEPEAATTKFWGKVGALLQIKTIFWFYAGYTLFTASVFAILAWVPALIIRQFNVGEDVAGVIMAANGAFMVVGVLAGGLWADRWQAKQPAGKMRFASNMVLISTIAVLLALFFIFILHPGGIFDLGIYSLTGFGLFMLFSAAAAAVNPAVMAVTQSVVTLELRSLVWGLGVTVIMIFGGAWSPAVTGYLSDRLGGGAQDLAISLMIVGALGFGAFICFWKSALYYPIDAARVSTKIDSAKTGPH